MKKYDVGISGLWMTCNYGAALTSYALYIVIHQMGYTPELIDHGGKPGLPARFREQENIFRQFFIEKNIPTTRTLSEKSDFEELNSRYETFVVGSDQVWRYEYNKRLGLYFFLDFVSAAHKKIAYGSSFGTDKCFAPQHFRLDAALLLNCFDAVSCREINGVDILKTQYSVDAKHVLDPVFLCPIEAYGQCLQDSKRKRPDKPYVLSYILNPDTDKRRIIQHVACREGKDLINMVDAQFEFENKKRALNLPNVVDNLSVDDWVFYIKHCDYLVTDSYHGLCFAILFKKPFVCVVHSSRGLSRLISLCESFGINERLVAPDVTAEQLDNMPGIEWESVHSILQTRKSEDKKWLQCALEAERSETKKLYNSLVDYLLQTRKESYELQKILIEYCAYDKVKHKYWYYWFMSKISWGKRRKKYKLKRMHLLLISASIANRLELYSKMLISE